MTIVLTAHQLFVDSFHLPQIERKMNRFASEIESKSRRFRIKSEQDWTKAYFNMLSDDMARGADYILQVLDRERK